MKHVWILNHHAVEPDGAGGARHHTLARHLRSHGWQAHLIASSVEHRSGRQRLPDHEAVRQEIVDGVPFLWLRTPPYRGNGVGRLRNMMAYTRAALRAEVARRLPAPTAVVGSSVHLLAAWAGARLARRHGVPFVLEVRDLWPQTLIDMGVLSPRSPIAWAMRRLERRLYRSADRIVVLLPRAGEHIERCGGDRSKVRYIPNGVDLSTWPVPPPRPAGTPFEFIYCGSHGRANGLDRLLLAMAEVRKRAGDRLRLRLVGEGPMKASLVEMARRLSLEAVSFEPAVPRRRVPEVLSQGDAVVVVLLDLAVYRYGISLNKLFDGLASGRPLVFAGDAANDPVREAGAGISVASCEPAEIAGALLAMAGLPEEQRSRMGAAGRAFVGEHHDAAVLARRFMEVLAEVEGGVR